jgi:hypothetical protein
MIPALRHTDFTAGLVPDAWTPDYRITTKIFGGLLGPEFIISTGGKSYRIGQPSLTQLERGALIEEMDLLEVDPDTYEAI